MVKNKKKCLKLLIIYLMCKLRFSSIFFTFLTMETNFFWKNNNNFEHLHVHLIV